MLDPQAIAALKELIGDDDAALAELIGSFLEEGPKLCAGLEQATAEGDAKEMARIAHTMKASARDFGTADLADSCLELERTGKTDDKAAACALVPKVLQDYRDAEAALQALQEQHSSKEGTA